MVKYKVANLVNLYPLSINIYVEVNVIIRTKVMPCSGMIYNTLLVNGPDLRDK